jgi:hypothetical protein
MTFLFEDGQVKINMDGYIKNLSVDIEGKSTTPAGVDLFVDEETRVRPDILLVVNYLTTRVNTFTLGGGSFYSSSHKQKLTTKSSTEAELVAAANSGGNILGTRNYLISRGFVTPPACLGQDNKSTIQVIRNGIRSGRRLKHLDNKIFFLKDYIEEKQLVVEYVPTECMVADIRTIQVDNICIECSCSTKIK